MDGTIIDYIIERILNVYILEKMVRRGPISLFVEGFFVPLIGKMQLYPENASKT
ncbi:MAG: hypothetical protein QXL89_06990 [Nitrososphaeria archaeon]